MIHFFSAIFKDPLDLSLKNPVQLQFLIFNTKDSEKWFDKLSKCIKSLPESYERFKNSLSKYESEIYTIETNDEGMHSIFIMDN